MTFYLIEDWEGARKRILKSINSWDGQNCFWINTSGNALDNASNETVNYENPLPNLFVHNIVGLINDDSIFLVDLALNQNERDAVEEKYDKERPGAVFTAYTAASIIRVLKENNTHAKIKVISSVDKIKEGWEVSLSEITNEDWFNTIHFIPSSKVAKAHLYDAVKRELLCN